MSTEIRAHPVGDAPRLHETYPDWVSGIQQQLRGLRVRFVHGRRCKALRRHRQRRGVSHRIGHRSSRVLGRPEGRPPPPLPQRCPMDPSLWAKAGSTQRAMCQNLRATVRIAGRGSSRPGKVDARPPEAGCALFESSPVVRHMPPAPALSCSSAHFSGPGGRCRLGGGQLPPAGSRRRPG